MKKRVQLICLLTVIILAGVLLVLEEEKRAWLCADETGNLSLLLKTEKGEETLLLWRDEEGENGNYYFFLPSFVENHDLYFSNAGNVNLCIDGERMSAGRRFRWENGKTYCVELTSAENGEKIRTADVRFMMSENIPALFIDTESGGMGSILEDKEHEETGNIVVIDANGTMEYRGEIARISGRGNSTWREYPKKSFSFSLENAQALCGLRSAKKWKLLGIVREGTRLNTKIAMDIGQALNMDYSPEAIWVDLYLNGEYTGNYLLCESVSVGEGRVEIHDLQKDNELSNPEIDFAQKIVEGSRKGFAMENPENITGGYLLEKDSVYYDEKESGFVTESGDEFALREPDCASMEQVEYIQDFVQRVDDVLTNDIENYQNYIDQDSFIGKFLIDEIMLNFDAYVTSAYFYKERDQELLFAGPLWDYDVTLGTTNDDEGRWTDYQQLIIDDLRSGSIEWFAKLYENETYYGRMLEIYEELLPFMENLIETQIDEYVAHVGASAKMDEIRWQSIRYGQDRWGHYVQYDNNVRYLKYFLAKRLNYLNERWQISYPEFEIPSDEAVHEVTFMKDGEIVETRTVKDGEALTELPELDGEMYRGWFYIYESGKYQSQFPIYEDVTLMAKERVEAE